ncbi:Rossmann-like and DUF2520 domain-containing protein [Falsiruegeria mediterranea]
MPKARVNVIGAGRVGRTLMHLLKETSEYSIQDVLSSQFRTAQEATQLVGAGRAVQDYAQLKPADLWLLTVPDTQISSVAQKLSETFDVDALSENSPVAVHCSGFFPADEMAPLKKLHWHLASMHPVLSFADPVAAQQQFKGALCGLEGDEDAVITVRPLIERLGADCFPINSDTKSLYHAAAVFSNNFTVVLQAIANEAWAQAGVPAEIARHLNKTLLQGTVENVIAEGPRNSLTGPAARGDTFVVTKQGEDVSKWHPAAGQIYLAMSELAKELKASGTTGS